MVSDAKIAAQALASLHALNPLTVTPSSADSSPTKSSDTPGDARSSLQPIVDVRTSAQSPKSAGDRRLTSSATDVRGADPAPAALSAPLMDVDDRVGADAGAEKERRDAALAASQRVLMRAAASTNPSIRAPSVVEHSAANESVVAPFLTALYAIVDEEATNHIICWHESGTSFFVHDRNLLAREVLGKYFKHSNFSSFHRQANMYGFKSSSAGVGSSLQFAHPLFLRDRRDLLGRISSRRSGTGSRKRRLAQAAAMEARTSTSSAAESTSPEQMPGTAAPLRTAATTLVSPPQLAANVEPSDAGECGKLDMSKRPAAPFVEKTFHLVSDPATDDIICWTVEGHSFVVRDLKRFSYELLPRHFKHNNFSSFVRQAHYYSFYKLGGANHWEFGHKHFMRGRADLLVNIKRSKRPSSRKDDEQDQHELDMHAHKRMRTDDDGTSPSFAPPRAADIPGLVSRVLASPFGKSPDAQLVSDLVRAEERRRDALALLDAARRSYDAAEAPVLATLERLLPDAPQVKTEATTPASTSQTATTPTSTSPSTTASFT